MHVGAFEEAPLPVPSVLFDLNRLRIPTYSVKRRRPVAAGALREGADARNHDLTCQLLSGLLVIVATED
jgi:hypothetical protein